MQNAMLNLLFTVVDRGKGDAVARLLQEDGVMFQCIALGTGTANKGLLSLLGLKDTAKDVVCSVIRSSVKKKAMRRLGHALEIDLPGKGIAFSVPVGSVGGSQTMNYFLGGEAPDQQQEASDTMEPIHDLIIAVVNRGFTDLVMEAALPAGARGGTVVHARGAGARQASQFFGITIQPEKEMVLILVPHEIKVPVMQAVTRGAGLTSEGQGLVFSLPVSDVMGVARMMNGQTQEEEEA